MTIMRETRCLVRAVSLRPLVARGDPRPTYTWKGVAINALILCVLMACSSTAIDTVAKEENWLKSPTGIKTVHVSVSYGFFPFWLAVPLASAVYKALFLLRSTESAYITLYSVTSFMLPMWIGRGLSVLVLSPADEKVIRMAFFAICTILSGIFICRNSHSRFKLQTPFKSMATLAATFILQLVLVVCSDIAPNHMLSIFRVRIT